MKCSVLVTAVLAFALAACPGGTPQPQQPQSPQPAQLVELKEPPPPPQPWNGEVTVQPTAGSVWVLAPVKDGQEQWLLILVDVQTQLVQASYEVAAQARLQALERATGSTSISSGIETVIIGSIQGPGPRPGPAGEPGDFIYLRALNVAAAAVNINNELRGVEGRVGASSGAAR